ncbi:MAG TPA: hypothetical protein VGL86_25250 [Polyangia bacterium]
MAAVIAFAFASPSARAADANTSKAKQLYDDGLTNYNLGHYDEALTAFEMGYRVRHDPAFLFNIAQCQRQLRRPDDAQRSYRAYLRESPTLPQTTRDEVQKLIAEMENSIEEQRTKQPPTGTQAPGANQPAEGQTPPPSPPPAATPPRVEQVPAAAERRPPAHRDSGRSKRLAGIALGAGGIALIAGGAVLAALSKQAGDEAYSPADHVYDYQADQRQQSLRAADIALFTVGGAALIVGTTLWIIGRKHEQPRSVSALGPPLSGGLNGAL